MEYKIDSEFFKVKPFEHQLEVLNQITDRPFFGLLWEMGTGKTFALIHLMRHIINQLIEQKKETKVLIVCPKTVLYNWEREIIMFSPNPNIGKSIAVIDGEKKKRIKDLTDPLKKIIIINYESIGRIPEIFNLLSSTIWDVMILDEAQRIKNHKAAQSKGVLKISAKARRRYIATGTPILNTMMDVFSLGLFLDKGAAFGSNYYQFRSRWFYDANAGWRASYNYFPDWKPRPELLEEFQKRLKSFTDRKLKVDCLDLPPKLYKSYYIEMEPHQRTLYDELKKELIAYFQQHVVVASNALTKVLRLNQITSGFLKDDITGNIHDISDSKLNALAEVVESIQPNKVIVWAYFKNDADRIMKKLAQYNPVKVNGETNNKQECIDKFQNDPACKVFVGQQRACGLGITLTAASYAIYFSQNYSLEDRLQSEDRCHRAGSERHENITYIDLICKDSVDEIIIKAVKAKKDLASNILDGIKEILC